jgi:hypothetical protein
VRYIPNQSGNKVARRRTGLRITKDFRREFGSILKPVRRLRFRGTSRARSSHRGCGKTNREKGDRSPDRFRGEMESCGNSVSARAFPQALSVGTSRPARGYPPPAALRLFWKPEIPKGGGVLRHLAPEFPLLHLATHNEARQVKHFMDLLIDWTLRCCHGRGGR